MPDSPYFIKLYGHLTDDAEAFSTSLAAVLGTDPETANRILAHAPMVIAKAKNKQAALRLKDKLIAIGATCLVESETGADSELFPIPAEAAPEKVRTGRKRKRDDREGVNFRIWTGVLVTAVAFFCIFSLVGYVSTFSWISERRPLSGAVEVSDKKPDLDPAARMARVVEINDELDALKKTLDELIEMKLMTKEEIQSPKGPAATDPLEMRKRKQELRAVNLKISDVNKQIKELRRELDRVRRSRN